MDKILAHQKIFLKSILTPESSLDLKAQPCGQLSKDEALSIYRNNYYTGLTKYLQNTYEACLELLTKDVFSSLTFAFIKEHPLKECHLDSYGQRFPIFLRESPFQENFPFIYELAQLENLIKEIFSEDEEEFKPIDFNTLKLQKKLRLGRYKSMSISFPVHQIWESLLYEGKEEITDIESESLLFIFRSGEKLFFRVLSKNCKFSPPESVSTEIVQLFYEFKNLFLK